MKQGVEKIEVMEILHKIKLHKKHAKIRPNAEAAARLEELEDMLSCTKRIEQALLWHGNAYPNNRY